MTYLIRLAAALVVAVPIRVSGQQAVVPRPDTLGANFDHSAPGRGTLSDYDFMVGRWAIRYQLRDSLSGAYAPVRTGEWTGRKSFETLFEDTFLLENPAGPAPTMTYRVFNQQRGLWEIQGVGTRRGVWQPGQSWSDGKDRFVVQQNPDRKLTLRIRYYAIEPNHFLWRADASRDGKTWVRDIMLIEATRKDPP